MSTFITKHVWPGRFRLVYLPALFRAVGHSGLEVVEMHNDRHNYELWARKFRERWVASTEQVRKATDDPTWRTHHLLQAGVAASMDDSTHTASAYRLVLAHRCPQRPPPCSLGRRLYRAVRTRR
jgi:cyclopropane fatty-acyl-phospholipid synthase-like methyltransferase